MANYQYKLFLYELKHFINWIILEDILLLIFVSNLLQVYAGKEKEAVSDMLPYLRLGYVSDPSEMQSVLSSQGPVCPVSSFIVNCYLHSLFIT